LGELLYQYFLWNFFGDAGDNLKKAGKHHALAASGGTLAQYNIRKGEKSPTNARILYCYYLSYQQNQIKKFKLVTGFAGGQEELNNILVRTAMAGRAP
jgi:hypothetical protein